MANTLPRYSFISRPFSDALDDLRSVSADIGTDRTDAIWRDVFGGDIETMQRKNKMCMLFAFRFDNTAMRVVPSFKLLRAIRMMQQARDAQRGVNTGF